MRDGQMMAQGIGAGLVPGDVRKMNLAAGADPATPKMPKLTDAVIQRLDLVFQRLCTIEDRQSSFVARVLPPEPREASGTRVQDAPAGNGPAAYEMERLFPGIHRRLDEIEFLCNRMDRIA